MKKIALLITVLCLLVVGCTPGRNTERGKSLHGEVAGFPEGYIHGVMLPANLLISAFDDNANIYEVHNNGYSYNFGFFLGLYLIYGGGIYSMRNKRKK